jgi:hypothetical protein
MPTCLRLYASCVPTTRYIQAMRLSWSRQAQHASHNKDAPAVPSFPGTTTRDKKRPLSQKGNVTKEVNLLLAIAHPDDESMFFLPTLLHLRDASQDDGSSERVVIHVLCLSTGAFVDPLTFTKELTANPALCAAHHHVHGTWPYWRLLLDCSSN